MRRSFLLTISLLSIAVAPRRANVKPARQRHHQQNPWRGHRQFTGDGDALVVVGGVRSARDRHARLPAGRRLGDEEVRRVGTAEHSHRAISLRPGMDHRALLRAHDRAADRAADRPAAMVFAVDQRTGDLRRRARAGHDRSRFRKVQRPAAGQDRRAPGAAPGSHARWPRRAAHERCRLERSDDVAAGGKPAGGGPDAAQEFAQSAAAFSRQ